MKKILSMRKAQPYGWGLAVLLLAPALLADPPAKGGDKGAGGKSDASKGDNGKPAEVATDAMTNFCKLLPLQKENYNARIPSFTNGILTSLMLADTLTRQDDDNIEMKNLRITMKGSEGAPDLHVAMKTATYHMPSKVLYSMRRSEVSRSDFRLEGDMLVFDTRSSQGKMTGHVKMTIFDTSALSGAPKEPEKKNATKAGAEKKDAAKENQPKQ